MASALSCNSYFLHLSSSYRCIIYSNLFFIEGCWTLFYDFDITAILKKNFVVLKLICSYLLFFWRHNVSKNNSIVVEKWFEIEKDFTE